MKVRALAIAALLTLPLVAAACGGSDDTNSGDRPSAQEISDAFVDQVPAGVDEAAAKAYADCIGEGLEASDLPNGVLRSIAAGEEETQIDADNEAEYTQIVTDVSTDCATEALSSAGFTTTTAAG